MEIYKILKDKFSYNFDSSIDTQKALIEEIETKAKTIFTFGDILNSSNISISKKETCQIFNEIFSDISISIYLMNCSINTGSKVILRRVLELGLGIIYFWDLPHRYWGWKSIDVYENDLSFRDSLDYLGSEAFKELLKMEYNIHDWEIDKEKINRLYRNLSNSIHGKYSTFETITEKSFEYNKDEYDIILSLIIKCENIIISLLANRFNDTFLKVKEIVPAIERYSYEY